MKLTARTLSLLAIVLTLLGGIAWFARFAWNPAENPEPNSIAHQQSPKGNAPTHLSNYVDEKERSVGVDQLSDSPIIDHLPAVSPGPTPVPTVGRVIDSAGSPIANAQVTVAEWQNMQRASAGFPIDNEQVLRTDEDGRFQCLPRSCEWSLFVEKAGYGSVLQTGNQLTSFSPERNELEDIVLALGGVVSGEVLDEDGVPVSGAKLAYTVKANSRTTVPDGSFFTLAVTDNQGRFVVEGIPFGNWALGIHHPDYISGLTAGTLQVEEPEHRNIEVRLERGATIEGFVSGIPEGEQLHSISLRPAVDEYNQDSADSYGYDRGGRRFAFGAGGHFQIGSLLPEQLYWLDVWTGFTSTYGTQRRSARVSALAGARDVRLVFDTGFGVTLQLLHSETREPISSALSVMVEFGEGYNELLIPEDPSLPGGVGWRDGIVRVENLVQPYAGAPLSVRVHGGSYEEYDREFLDTPSHGLLDLGPILLKPFKVVNQPVYRTDVRVVSADGRALPHANIEVDLPPRNGIFESAWTNDQGLCTVSSKVEGTGSVRPTINSLMYERQTGVAVLYAPKFEQQAISVEFQSGDRKEVEMRLPVRADLELRISFGSTGPVPTLVMLSGRKHEASSELRVFGMPLNGWRKFDALEAKSLRFRGLHAGSWDVCLKDEAGLCFQVTRLQLVPGPQLQTLNFDPQQVSGRVLDETGSPMAGALILLNKEGRYSHDGLEDEFRSRKSNRASIGNRSATITRTAKDGTWSFCLASPGGLYVVHAVERGYARAKSKVFSPSTEPLQLADLPLQRSGALRIFATDQESDPWVKIAPADWSLRRAFEANDFGRCNFLGGRGVIRGLKPGAWKLYWRPQDAETREESKVYEYEVLVGEMAEVHLSDTD